MPKTTWARLHYPKAGAATMQLAIYITLLGGAPALADSWNVVEGDWSVSSNWADNSEPTASDDAAIDNDGTARVLVPGAEAQDVIVGDGLSGTVNISGGGTLSSRNSNIGSDAGSVGTATVTGSSSWANGSGFSVGVAGTGMLTISDGGAVTSGSGSFGEAAGSNGTVIVTGNGSSWTSNIGTLIVGNGGTGTLTISDGGEVRNYNSYIGRFWDSSGAATVSGVGSIWTNSSAIHVGNTGIGALTVEGGGAVSNTYGYIGSGFGSNGTAIVTGSGSTWTNTNSLIVGQRGTGALMVEAGGAVSNTTGYIGRYGGSGGTASVTGAGSTWTNSDALYVGNNGTGILTVENGGTVNNGLGSLGEATGSSGAATVTGSGSTWANSGTLYIGNNGTGKLTIADGGTVTVTGSTVIANLADSTGTLYIGGAEGSPAAAPGTLQTGSLLFGAGAGDIVFNHASESHVFDHDVGGNGTLNFLNGTTSLTGDYSGFIGPVELTGGTLSVDTTLQSGVTVDSGATLAGSGTLGDTVVASGGNLAPGNSVGTLTVEGDLTLNPGSFLEFELGTPGSVSNPASGVSDRVLVDGDLVLDGTLNLAQSGAAGDGTAALGYYRLISYGGNLTDNVLDIGSTPALADPSIYTLQAGSGRVDLFIAAAGDDTLQHWEGGDGSWTTVNWLNQDGGAEVSWAGKHAIFQDTGSTQGGTIRVTGTPSFKGLQFVDTGYRLAGDGRLLIDGSEAADGNAEIRVLADSAEITTEITGSGGITKTQGGRLVLSGRNTYEGGTRLSEGTVEIASDANLGHSSGGLTFTSGTLATTASFDSARDMLLTGSGTIEVANDTQFGLTGNLTGDGDLVKTGRGTLRFEGNGTSFTGTSSVADGLLSLGADSYLGGTMAVLSGGTLAGSGTLGDTLVASGGNLAPGNSIGTLTVEGDITFESDSLYAIEVDPSSGDSDLIRATGQALLEGGRVVHVGLEGDYQPYSTYTILSADGGVQGAFDTATSNFPFLSADLSYDASNVYLALARNSAPFADLARTDNQKATAEGADSLGAGNTIHDAIVGQADEATISSAFDALSGELHASAKSSLLDDSRFLRSAVTERLRAASIRGIPASSQMVQAYGSGGAESVSVSSERLATWGQAYGSWASYDGDGNAADLDRSIGGIFLGADAPLGERTRLGLVLGYGHSSLEVDDRASSADIDSYTLGAYAGTEVAGFALQLGAAHSWHEIDSKRSVVFPGFSERPEADYNARTLQAFGEVGYSFDRGTTSLEPFANLAWVRLHRDGFEESGEAGLSGEAEDDNLAFTTLGLRAETMFEIAGMAATLHGSLGWRHAFGEVEQDSTHSFAGGSPFTVSGVPLARNAAMLDAGFALAIAPGINLGLSYRGQLGNSIQDHGLDASLSIRF